MKKTLKFLGIVLLTAAVSAATTVLVIRNTNKQTLFGDQLVVATDSTGLPLAYAKFNALPEAGETDFTVAAELSVNAVVHVKTTYNARQQQYSVDPLLEFFFGRPSNPRSSQAQQASGSGVILSADGYIVTNNHVIDKADKIEVVLNDKREYEATLVGTDPNTDIALLKIDAQDLPVIAVGNSDDLRVGEWVLAVGNPFNLTSTVTAGIVSAKARNINIISSEMKIESFIQTDAAVNPGNSGGALVNTRGELVGINTAIASQTGSYTGYSFAVPTSIMKKVVNDIKQFGIVQRAVLGVQIQEITNELQKEKRLTTLQGAYVAAVVEESAAEKAGVKVGDVITEVNGTALKTANDLQEQLGRYRPGDNVTLTVLRDGKLLTLNAELTNKSGGTQLVEKNDTSSLLGAEFKAVDEQVRQRLGINYGIQIKSLSSGKLKQAGLQKDLIILKANNRSIRSEEDLNDVVNNAMQAAKRERALFLTCCTTSGKVSYFAINLDE